MSRDPEGISPKSGRKKQRVGVVGLRMWGRSRGLVPPRPESGLFPVVLGDDLSW